MFKTLAVVAATLALASAQCYQEDCDPNQCKLPNCACAGDEPLITVDKRPQIVYLTFDDAMTQEFDDLYFSELFMPDANNNYLFKNPNGCPVRATFFVTSKSNNYQVTHKYWRYHHEIAAHSITHRADITEYWAALNATGWEEEMVGVREMIAKFGKIPKTDIVGMRAPFLQGGGDAMYEMMANNGFVYDCSQPSVTFGMENLKFGRWPHTYDYYNDMGCQIEPCPECPWPGIWSQPILDFKDGRNGGNGYPCGMTDTCQTDPNDGEDPQAIFNMLLKNFEWSYNGNTRAPIGIYIHSAWFVRENSWHYEGYKMFLKHLQDTYQDVWIVPIIEGIEYFQTINPNTSTQYTNDELLAGDFDAFNCEPDPRPDDCQPKLCEFDIDNNLDFPGIDKYYMHICQLTCPRNFPWLGKPLG